MENNLEQRLRVLREELTSILMRNRGNRDNAVAELNAFGIVDKSVIDNILKSFSEKEEWNDIHNKTFIRAFQSTSGVDFTTDINKARDKAVSYSDIFDGIISSLAWKKLADEIDMSEVDEDFLNQLSLHDIKEEDIKNPGLKLTYGYFLKNKKQEKELARVLKVGERLEQEKANLERNGLALRTAYVNLQKLFAQRIREDDEKYQKALGVISGLKQRLGELQNRTFLQFIKSKFMRQEALPESKIEDIASTLLTTGEKLAPDTLPGKSLEDILGAKSISNRDVAKSQGWGQR